MNVEGGTGAVAAASLVSVVIPCYNQARFLGDALASVHTQSYRPVEVIVVDDGSTEDIRSVACKSGDTRYVRQPNSGVAAARNLGFFCSRGSYVVFLDSDDRLTADALAVGVRILEEHPEAAAAVGLCQVIGEQGERIPFRQQDPVGEDCYMELLCENFIWMPAQVMYRRDAFSLAGRFDTSVDACADYDLYLRMARTSRLALHRSIVAEYRRHDTNMSSDGALMLKSALTCLERQRAHIGSDERYLAALESGRQFWKEFYGDQAVESIRTGVRQPSTWLGVLRVAAVLARHNPTRLAFHVWRKIRRSIRS